jgi:hypothetical protein
MLSRLAVVVLVCSACGDDGGKAGDAAIVFPDIDNGSCGDQLRFTGEYVDWDNDASFCGIAEALFEVPGGAMDTTAPNGRFDLCIPRAPATTLVDITPPTASSQCTVPPAGYAVPSIAVASPAVILAGNLFHGSNFTTVRQQSFFMDAGLTFDPTKAQVFVHVDGTARAVSIDAAHGTAQAIVATTWAAGDTGKDVFFPNVDVGGGTTMLTVAGGAIGTGAIPLVAGKMTNVNVIAN